MGIIQSIPSQCPTELACRLAQRLVQKWQCEKEEWTVRMQDEDFKSSQFEQPLLSHKLHFGHLKRIQVHTETQRIHRDQKLSQ